MKKIIVISVILFVGAITLLALILNYKIEGNYLNNRYMYLDDGSYHLKFRNGEIFLEGENYKGKIYEYVGSYSAEKNHTYRIKLIKEGIELTITTHLLGLKISEVDKKLLKIKSPDIGVDFIRTL